jgi:RND family efflux transporter MFP subunit
MNNQSDPTPQSNMVSSNGDTALRVRAIRPQMKLPVSAPEPPYEKELTQVTSTPSGLQQEQVEQPVPIPSSPEQQKVASVSPPLPIPGRRFNPPWWSGRKNRRLILIGAVLCLIALLGAISLYEIRQATPNVTVYQVPVQNVSQFIGGGGIVFPRQRLNFSYPAPERVTAVLVQAGDQVTINQPLVQLDPIQLNAEIAQAADDLAAAALYLENVSATGNPVTIAQAKQAYNLAKDKYDTLVAKSSSPLLHRNALVSPMNGVVTDVNINAGEVFAANKTLLTIMDESTVIVHAKIPLSNLGQVHPGQQAVVTPSALPSLNLNGTVSAIVPRADPQTDTFEVWVEVVNSDKTLLPGMSVFVRIQSAGRAFVVPRLAVLNLDYGPLVFIVRDQHAYLQRVHIVGRSISFIFIDSGLSAGDKVVLVGLGTLKNGQRIRVAGIESQTS